METQTSTYYLEIPEVDCKKMFFAKLSDETGFALIDSLLKDKCVCEESNQFIKTKQEVKSAIMAGKHLIAYVAIDPIRASEKVYTTYNRGPKATPCLIVGWGDYEYITLKTPLGVSKRHRGYFMVIPATEDMTMDNVRLIPYKHFDICDLDDTPNLIKEVWAVNNLSNDIREFRVPAFQLKIGDNCIVCEGISYCTEGAYYHSYGNPLVPIRDIAERLGYSVNWNKRKRRVDIMSHNNHIQIFIDENYCIVDGEKIDITFPATINKYAKRTYVNLSFVKKIMKLDARFDKGTETVLIYN